MTKDSQGYLTTTQHYKGFDLVTKSKKGLGMKCHCIKDGKEIFTQRFLLIKPELLLKRMADRVDKYLSGEWVPAKILKQLNTLNNDN